MIPVPAVTDEQNLVINPHFDQNPKHVRSMKPGEIAPYWGSASETPDLNWVNGNSCGGFRVLGVNYEVLRGELKTPLEAGAEYCFSMKLRMRKTNHVAVNNLGALFLPDARAVRDPNKAWNMEPKVVSATPVYIALRDTWQTVTGRITAKGGEKYVYIGQFSDDRMFKAILIDSMHWFECYYLVDDVTLTPTDTADCPCNSTDCNVPAVVVAANKPKLPEKPKEGAQLVFRNIQFETGSAELLPSAYPSLDSLLRLLNVYPDLHIRIEGHTDNMGDPTKNQTLSEERARVVYEYIRDHGIGAYRLSHAGFGASRPVADNSTPGGRAINRRVAFVVGNNP